MAVFGRGFATYSSNRGNEKMICLLCDDVLEMNCYSRQLLERRSFGLATASSFLLCEWKHSMFGTREKRRYS